MNPIELAALAKAAAARLGFSACGICDLRPSRTSDAFNNWLERGFAGEMRYMARQAPIRLEPALAWGPAKSAVVVLHNYGTEDSATERGYRVARYAQHLDYHTVTKQKLAELGGEIVRGAGSGSSKCYVDAGPLPERELAQRAGLGWFGKNTMLISPRLGSYTFIGVVLTDLELARDEPFEADRCGSCTRCLDACPTEAFPSPRVLDATRCISYLTIEQRGPIPEEYHAGIGEHLFGCDVCQEVCPWNHKFAQPATEPGFRPLQPDAWPALEEILAMDDAAFEARFGPTPLERSRREGLQRNARVVAANRSGPASP